jgi:hypothetical protein
VSVSRSARSAAVPGATMVSTLLLFMMLYYCS